MRILYLFLIVNICLLNTTFGQKYKKLGICFSDINKKCSITRKELISFIEDINYLIEIEGMKDTIIGIPCMDASLYDSSFVTVNCKVSHIEERINNFCICNGKLKRVTLCIVDLRCIDSVYANQIYKLFVIEQKKILENKLRIGECYNFLLYQIFGFGENNIRQPSKDVIVGQGPKRSFFYKGILMPYVEEKETYIYVESPQFLFPFCKTST